MINIEEYLDEPTLQKILLEEVRDKIKEYFTESNITRLIGNISYQHIYQLVDEALGEESLSELLKNKVMELINQMTVFSVFKEPNTWDKGSNYGHKIVQETLKENTNKIKEEVEKQITPATQQALKDNLEYYIKEAIIQTLREAN